MPFVRSINSIIKNLLNYRKIGHDIRKQLLFRFIFQYLFFRSIILFEETGFFEVFIKKLELLLSLTIKAIPLKVFGRCGAGKITFFQKGVFPVKHFLQHPLFSSPPEKSIIY